MANEQIETGDFEFGKVSEVKAMVAVDGSRESMKALQTAIDCSKNPENTFFYIVTSLTIPNIPPFQIPLTIEDELIEKSKELLRNCFAILSKQNVKKFKGYLLSSNNTRKDLIKFSDKLEPDCIFIGSRGLSKLDNILIGSTSLYVLNNAKYPVCIVKL